jgi:prephenate dehydratase
MKVAYQGEPGAYSEAALIEYFKQKNAKEIVPLGKINFGGVFEAVKNGEAAFGFIPIENSVEGSIDRNHDLLTENDLHIIGEHYFRVRHCLIAHPGIGLDQLERVISHPQALGQCRLNLEKMTQAQVEPVYDTAGSVKMIKDEAARTTAAIASKRAAEIYDMPVLVEGIEDNPTNITRFFVISTEPVIANHDAKTSIVFSLINEPGALFKALSTFALRNIDLTKIASRPLVGKPGEYRFFIDLAGSIKEETVKRALDHLDEYAVTLRVLGSYPRKNFESCLE